MHPVQFLESKDMTHQTGIRLIVALIVASASLLLANPATAEQDSALDTGPVVRHQLLYRSTRAEVAPLAGMTLNDSYMRNGILGASLSYHLTNSWGLSVVGGFGLLQFETDLRERVETTLEASRPDQLDDLSYSYIKALAGAELTYAPIIGKFSIFDGAITDFDIHLIGGFTFLFEAAESARDGADPDPQLEGLRPSPTLGVGTRFFFGDGIAATLQLRNYLYSRAEVSSLGANPEFANTPLLTFGLSFFLPQEVKISR
jgi:outer membrane beta-barrel protein